MTIEEFIAARLGEREEAANEAIRLETIWARDDYALEYEWVRFRRTPGGQTASSMFVAGAPAPAEVLRQCAALRLALEFWQGLTRLRTIAAIWANHPDYQQEWAK